MTATATPSRRVRLASKRATVLDTNPIPTLGQIEMPRIQAITLIVAPLIPLALCAVMLSAYLIGGAR